MSWRAAARSLPTMLRVEMAATLAYRAEFAVWMLTTTLPLIMLGLWSSVASDGPFGAFGQREFVAYYLATLVVRNLTGSWIVWQVDEEIRSGDLSMRLLLPIHPFVSYAATHLAAIPLRSLLALPIALILLFSSAGSLLIGDLPRLALLAFALLGSWALTFFALLLIASLGLFVERSLALFDVYLGIFGLFSGYLIPLSLLPSWVRELASALPFEYMLAFPVELLIGMQSAEEATRNLALQWSFATLAFVVSRWVWKRGIRRYEAYGS